MKEKMLNLAKYEKETEKTFLELAKGFWRVNYENGHTAWNAHHQMSH